MAFIGALCFLFKYYVDKYNMLYVFPFEFESNGMTVSFLAKYSIVGILLFNV